MLVTFISLFLLIPGATETKSAREVSPAQIPAIYRIPQDTAELMIQHFRSKKVDINDDKWMDGRDKKVMRVRFDKSVLALLLGDRVTGHEFFNAAFVTDWKGRTKNTPTLILRIVKNTTSAQALEMEYYLPVEERLCPPPPDCNTIIMPE